jgi:anti-sigma factor RsiW
MREKILAGLGVQQPRVRQKTIPGFSTPWLAGLAAAFSIIVSVTVILSYQHRFAEEQLIQDVLSGHLRTLASGQHASGSPAPLPESVARLKNQLDFAPSIPDLSHVGLNLVDAKPDYLQQRKVASLIYRKDGHVVNLLTWPSPDVDDAVREVHIKQGYKMIYWCQDNMNYWIVSDLNQQSLDGIARYLQDELLR